MIQLQRHIHKNIAKGTTDPRVEFISQVLTRFPSCIGDPVFENGFDPKSVQEKPKPKKRDISEEKQNG